METQVLTLPDFVPTSDNRLYRGKIRDRCRLSRGDHQVIAYYAKEQELVAATTPRRVSIAITVKRGRGPDPSNVLKVLLDGLVNCGLLIGDDALHVELGGVTVARGSSRQTTVTLTDLPWPEGKGPQTCPPRPLARRVRRPGHCQGGLTGGRA
jgi:hypothetical protein